MVSHDGGGAVPGGIEPFYGAIVLVNDLRVVQPMTLMSMGLYSDPAGAWLPSVSF